MTHARQSRHKTGLGLGLALLALGLASTVQAATMQDPAALQSHVVEFLKQQTTGVAGKVSIDVKAPTAELPACAALDAFQTPGSRSIGRISVGVRCLAPSSWTVYLSAQVKVIGMYAVTLQALPANHELVAADFTLREGDLGSLPADVVTQVDDLLGFRTVSGLAAGAPLRIRLLRPPMVVQQGQSTRVIVNGPGFSIQSEGQALANAGLGDRVRVKTRSGQVISGIAEEGQQVSVSF